MGSTGWPTNWRRFRNGDFTAIIYFSGHGYVEADDIYLIPYDLNLRRTRTSAIRASDFADVVARLTPRRLLSVSPPLSRGLVWVLSRRRRCRRHCSAAISRALFPPEAKSLAADRLAGGAGRAVLRSCQPASPRARRRPHTLHFSPHPEAALGHAQPSGGAAEAPVSTWPSSPRRPAKCAGTAEPSRTPSHSSGDWHSPGCAGAWRRRARQGGRRRPIHSRRCSIGAPMPLVVSWQPPSAVRAPLPRPAATPSANVRPRSVATTAAPSSAARRSSATTTTTTGRWPAAAPRAGTPSPAGRR